MDDKNNAIWILVEMMLSGMCGQSEREAFIGFLQQHFITKDSVMSDARLQVSDRFFFAFDGGCKLTAIKELRSCNAPWMKLRFAVDLYDALEKARNGKRQPSGAIPPQV